MKQSLDLIVFDFSGTLSLTAVEFGKSEKLVPVLEKSGLVKLGVASEAFFWDEIVYPTWVEGSTTGRGYLGVLTDRIRDLGLHAPEDPHPDETIQGAVSYLLDRYFDQCRIDIRWRTLLQDLNESPSVQVLIATDHYAEATSVIAGRLEDWRIDVVTLSQAVPGTRNPFIIANSSDMGFHKADIRFWRLVSDKLSLPEPYRVLLVDDFGGNEDSSDPYGDPGRVSVRRQETDRVLRDVFGDRVEIYSFLVEKANGITREAADRDGLYGFYICRAVSHIRSFLGLGRPL